jgi:hypothetical protein
MKDVIRAQKRADELKERALESLTAFGGEVTIERTRYQAQASTIYRRRVGRVERTIIELAEQGMPATEIAKDTRWTVWRVRRFLASLEGDVKETH